MFAYSINKNTMKGRLLAMAVEETITDSMRWILLIGSSTKSLSPKKTTVMAMQTKKAQQTPRAELNLKAF